MEYGSCLCGRVSFRIEGELEPSRCAIAQCRKAQGGPLVTVIPVAAQRVPLSTAELLRSESSPGKQRLFCSERGSPVLSRRQSLPGVVRVRAGLINEPLPFGPRNTPTRSQSKLVAHRGWIAAVQGLCSAEMPTGRRDI
jgi:hypothetical protein